MSASSGAQHRLHAISVRLRPRRVATVPAGMPRSAHGNTSAATTRAIREGEPVVVSTNHGSARAVICEPVAEMTSAATSAARGGRRSTPRIVPEPSDAREQCADVVGVCAHRGDADQLVEDRRCRFVTVRGDGAA